MTQSEPSMKIGELAAKAELNTRTIHYYEGLGLLEPVTRMAGGHRRYDQSSLNRLRLIARLKSVGLSLEEIVDVLPAYEADVSGVQGKTKVLALLWGHLEDTNQQIKELSVFRDELITNIARMQVFAEQAAGNEVSVLTPIPDYTSEPSR